MKSAPQHAFRSRAPLRLGLAGGGTDVEPFSSLFGGEVLNATIKLYAHCKLVPSFDKEIEIRALDRGEYIVINSHQLTDLEGTLPLHSGVIAYFYRNGWLSHDQGFRLTSYADCPAGTGLGSSSTMVVALIKVFAEWLDVSLTRYDIARAAVEIERMDLGLSGGLQDQYAAAFGGVNYMEFTGGGNVFVNPLSIDYSTRARLEAAIVLFHTGVSRDSAAIIDQQIENSEKRDSASIEALLEIKQSATKMKHAVVSGDIPMFTKIINQGWTEKKKIASKISNDHLESIYKIAIAAGANAGKISGAGGGGFFIFITPYENKLNLIQKLSQLNGEVRTTSFCEEGVIGWRELISVGDS